MVIFCEWINIVKVGVVVVVVIKIMGWFNDFLVMVFEIFVYGVLDDWFIYE